MAVPDMGLYYPGTDEWYLPSLSIAWDAGPIAITSTTAFLSRAVDQLSDYNVSHAVAYGQRPIPYPNDYDTSDQHQRQKNWTQELRIQNTNTDSPLAAVGGLYFERKEQRSIQGVDSNFLQLMNPYYNAVNGGPPFGDDTSAYVNYYGMGAIGPHGTQVYYANFLAIDQQYAVFAQADWKFIDRMKLTAGLRYSRNTTSFVSVYNGAENTSTAPQGHDCLPGTYLTGCVPVATGQYAPGEGPFAPAFTNSTINARDSAVTPKVGLEFQATPRDMFYISASKGFRPGAAQGIMGAGCSAELARLGFTDSSGNGASPPTYNRDSVWSYEVGAKDRLFDGHLRINASAFLMKWSDIQSSVSVVSCNQSFVTNLGGATGKGFDLELSYDLTDHLSLGLMGGHAVISFDDRAKRGSSIVYSQGSSIPNAGAPTRATLLGDYNVPVSDKITGYVHVDYAYTSQYRRTGNTDPLVSNYDPHTIPLPATHIATARAGALYDKIDLSVFVTNLFNSTPYTYYSRTGLSYFAQTFQPRTIGVTASYRF
jgi:outer membrane receptor protein involved in Fe transport